MYCRNCGNQINKKTVVCPHCCVPVYVGVKYCQQCGAKTEENAEKCENCASELQESIVKNKEIFQKSRGIAELLSMFGVFGLENFYLGYVKRGIAQVLISLTGVGIVVTITWGIVDFLRLNMNKINRDAYGIPLKR